MAAAPSTASAQFAVYDIANHIENAISAVHAATQVVNQATQIAQQLDQIRYQLQALEKLGMPTWRELPLFMRDLDALMSTGEAIAYSAADLNARLEETFPGYRLPDDLNVSRETRMQLNRTLATMHNALRTTARQMEELDAGMSNLQQIKRQMGSIRGHQEALELGATLQAHAAEELVMVRQNLAVLNNVLTVAHAEQLQQRLQAEAIREQLLRNTEMRARSTSSGLATSWE